MPIQSQIDTSFYSQMNPQNRIGEILGLAKGISSIYNTAKAEKRADNEREQDTYLNNILGQHLAGWNGNADDYNRRTKSAIAEILKYDSRLYGKAADMISSGSKQAYEQEQYRIANERGRLRNEAARRYLAEQNRMPPVRPQEPAPYYTPPRKVRQWNI